MIDVMLPLLTSLEKSWEEFSYRKFVQDRNSAESARVRAQAETMLNIGHLTAAAVLTLWHIR